MNTIMNDKTGIEFNVSNIVKWINDSHNEFYPFYESELYQIVNEYLYNYYGGYGTAHLCYCVFFADIVHEMLMEEMMDKGMFNVVETDYGTEYILIKTGK